MEKIAIKIKNVSKDYHIYRTNFRRMIGILFRKKGAEVRHALKDIQLEINAGERVAVFGQVESGCSTLMRIVSEVTYPSHGSVKINGRVNAFLDIKAGMDNELVCTENLYLKGMILGIPKEKITDKQEKLLAFGDADAFADLPLKRTPKGTDSKLALAIHMEKETDVFILDQSFSKGGLECRRKCEQALMNWFHENPGMTVLMATRRIAFANKTCTRGIILHKGRVVYDGPVEEAGRKFKEEYYRKGNRSKKQEELQLFEMDSDEIEE